MKSWPQWRKKGKRKREKKEGKLKGADDTHQPQMDKERRDTEPVIR